MRQLVYLRKNIDRRNLVDRHAWFQFLAQINGAKILSLDELLGETEASSFDEKTDEILERRAKEILAQKQAQYGRQ